MLKKEDEENGRNQRWGTLKAEEDKVTTALHLESLQWKKWLDVDAQCDQRTRCWEKWLALMADHCLPEQIKLLCHGYNTCLQESFNATRVTLTPKDRAFWGSFACRSELTVMKWNQGWVYVGRIADLMQTSLTSENIDTLRKWAKEKDREAHRRQTREMRKKVAMRSKEAEMRMRHQQLLAVKEKKVRENAEKKKKKKAKEESEKSQSEAKAAPSLVTEEAAPTPLTDVPHSQPLPLVAPFTPSPIHRASSSPRSAASVRRSLSLKYKSPTDKQQPFPTSVETEAAFTTPKPPRRSSRKLLCWGAPFVAVVLRLHLLQSPLLLLVLVG